MFELIEQLRYSIGKFMITLLSNIETKNWHVLFTRPNQERTVCKSLIRRGVNCFLPDRKEYRQWSDRKKMVIVPLFPNYVFAQMASCQRSLIFDIPGVIRILPNNRNPVFVSVKEIEVISRIRQFEPQVVDEEIKLNDGIRILDGPLKGLCGTVVRRKGREKFIIYVESLHKSLSIELPCTYTRRIYS